MRSFLLLLLSSSFPTIGPLLSLVSANQCFFSSLLISVLAHRPVRWFLLDLTRIPCRNPCRHSSAV
ncbi:DEAD-box ATP-dependent RNA helicase 36-like [Gossypium australe]|uniref:DEAD-box ATP-dependent RNA helicase 36-like n=1 Tax=Gossypium australe TaxID=47621 RepID=A0A5B6VPI3_9ROSI|nr:DEAD-box ATP-dependent RNA helicase 36-like [Gossypium australe]